jgi:hypothetical protein
MTALHKGEPRYIVVTVTGYTITPGYHESNSRAEMTCYAILDRAYNHRQVAEFPTTIRNRQPVMEERAHLVCDALNNNTPVPWWDKPKGRLRYGPQEP